MHKCHVCNGDCRTGLIHSDCAGLSYLDGVIVFCLYDNLAKDLIHEIKYKFHFSIIEDIAEIMANFLRLYQFPDGLIISSIPLHKSKNNFRGFNQSDLLGKKTAKIIGYEYIELLKRQRKTKTQVNLSKEEREVNLKDAFIIKDKKDLIGHNEVLLIDDVYTTGTTLNECAKVLKANGVEKVYGYVFARGK